VSHEPHPPRNSFGEVHFNYRQPRTPEQLAAYYANQRPNPKHVKILREGIAQFRRMLAQKDGPVLITPGRVVLPAGENKPAGGSVTCSPANVCAATRHAGVGMV
jgi:hypothetical protein